MNPLLFTVTLAVLPVEAPTADPSRGLTAALAAQVIAQMLDVSTTSAGIATGRGREVNPLMTWAVNDPLLLGLVKGAAAVGITLALLHAAKTQPKAAQIAAWLIAGMTTAVAISNARQMRKGAVR